MLLHHCISFKQKQNKMGNVFGGESQAKLILIESDGKPKEIKFGKKDVVEGIPVMRESLEKHKESGYRSVEFYIGADTKYVPDESKVIGLIDALRTPPSVKKKGAVVLEMPFVSTEEPTDDKICGYGIKVDKLIIHAVFGRPSWANLNSNDSARLFANHLIFVISTLNVECGELSFTCSQTADEHRAIIVKILSPFIKSK